MKTIFKIILLFIALFIFTSVYILYDIYSFANKGIVKSDAIMVLGCRVRGEEPSLSLEMRMKTAIKLYSEGYGKYIVLSGGKGPGEDISEAEAMRRYFIGNGIDEKYLIIEDKSTSTYENFKYSKPLIDEKGIKNIIVVSNGYHLKRASNIAEQLNVNATYKGFVLKGRYFIAEIKGALREVLATYKYMLLRK